MWQSYNIMVVLLQHPNDDILPLTNQGLPGEDGAAYSALVGSSTSAPIGDYTLQGIAFGWDLEDSSYSPVEPQFTTDVAFLILDFYNASGEPATVFGLLTSVTTDEAGTAAAYTPFPKLSSYLAQA